MAITVTNAKIVVNGQEIPIENFELKDTEHLIINLTHELPAIVAQLEHCEYTCIAGRLELNTAFIRLQEIAQLLTETKQTI